MMLGMMQSRTSMMPRSLTTPGGVRFLDPAHYVTQEELDRSDRRWRAMRERAWARAAAQACLSGLGTGRSSSSSASVASGWADDAATLVGSVRYYAAARSAVREWGERNSTGSGSRRRQQQHRQSQTPEQPHIQRSHTTSGGSLTGAAASDDASFFSLPASDGLLETHSLGRRPTQSSVAESASQASNMLDDADPFSDSAGNVFRGTLAAMTASAPSASRRTPVMPQVLPPQPQRRRSSAAHLTRYGSRSTHRQMHAQHSGARMSTSASGGSIGASAASNQGDHNERRGAARLLAIRNQMRRRKISEALQRLLGGVRV